MNELGLLRIFRSIYWDAIGGPLLFCPWDGVLVGVIKAAMVFHQSAFFSR